MIRRGAFGRCDELSGAPLVYRQRIDPRHIISYLACLSRPLRDRGLDTGFFSKYSVLHGQDVRLAPILERCRSRTGTRLRSHIPAHSCPATRVSRHTRQIGRHPTGQRPDFSPYRAVTAPDCFRVFKLPIMTFFSKFVRTISDTSDIFTGQTMVADRGLLNGQILFNPFAPQPSRSAIPQGGTLTPGLLSRAELQRVVADMVG